MCEGRRDGKVAKTETQFDFAVDCNLFIKVRHRLVEVTVEKTCQTAAVKQNTVNNNIQDFMLLPKTGRQKWTKLLTIYKTHLTSWD